MEWIVIIFPKRMVSHFATKSYSRMDVCIRSPSQGAIAEVYAFSFEPFIVRETSTTITCRFMAGGYTSVYVTYMMGFVTVHEYIRNDELKRIVEDNSA